MDRQLVTNFLMSQRVMEVVQSLHDHSWSEPDRVVILDVSHALSGIAEDLSAPSPECTGWTYVIEHKRGTSLTGLAASEEGAKQRLYDEWVAYWWEEEMGSLPMPEDRDEAIEAYMHEVGEERLKEFFCLCKIPVPWPERFDVE